MVPRDFYARAEFGKAIEEARAIIFPKMNRTSIGVERRRIFYRREPEEDLSLDLEWQFQFGHERIHPCSGGEDKLIGAIFSLKCEKAHSFSVLFPANSRFFKIYVGAMF